MSQQEVTNTFFTLPQDLIDAVRALSQSLDASPQEIITAAVDHFTRIPEQQRKAILKGTSMRRRG